MKKIVALIFVMFLSSACVQKQNERMLCNTASGTSSNLNELSWSCYTDKGAEEDYVGIKSIMENGWTPLSVGNGNGSTMQGEYTAHFWLTTTTIIFEKKVTK